MLGADSNLWVVKFQNNPQHVRVLANELIASRLAEAIGLTVPATDVIEVTPWLVENTPDMIYELNLGRRERYCSGLQFGSKFIGGLMPGQLVDYLPDPQLQEVRNLGEFAGILCLDKWAGNCNGRQAVFSRRAKERKYKATFIDQGFCFNAGDWTFPDSPLRGTYGRNRVYEQVTGWGSFEPWLGRIESMQLETLAKIAEIVPTQWYGGNEVVLDRLLEQLLKRTSRVRDLITSFRDSDREPFPLWTRSKAVSVPVDLVDPRQTSGFVM